MWYAVYDSTTGELRSQGSHVADAAMLAEKGLATKAYPSRPDKLWNADTRAFDLDTPLPGRRISADDFQRRLTIQELAGLIETSQTDAMITAFFRRLDAADYVDLDSAEVRGFSQYFVDKGYLSAERVNEILS